MKSNTFLWISIVLNFILGVWLWRVLHIQPNNEAIQQSKDRIIFIEAQRKPLLIEIDSLRSVNIALEELLNVKVQYKTIIIKQKNEKILHIKSLSTDSSFQYFARRLSEVGRNQ